MLPFVIDNFHLQSLHGLMSHHDLRRSRRRIDTIGTVEGAINQELECRLGTHTNGPIEFTERGSPLEGPVKVLDQYVNEFPEHTLLQIRLLKIYGHMGDMEIRGVLTLAAYDRVEWELGT